MELYLDCAATTKIDKDVLDKYISLISSEYGSTGSLHKYGEIALSIENDARNKMAMLLGVKPSEVLFCSGATEGNNYAIKGVAFNYKKRGNTIITSKVEHPSVLQCFEQLEKEYGFNCIYLDVDDNGIIDLNQLKNVMSNDVILVSIMYVNHELGTIMPIKKIREILNNYPKVIFHSDITQAIGKVDVDLSLVDLATASSHKIHSVKGSGFIVKKEKVTLFPLISGHPARNELRAGTSPWANNAVLPIALEKSISNFKNNYNQMKLVQKELIDRISKLDGTIINTNYDNSIPNIVNFSLIGYNPEVVVRALSAKGIYVSSRSVCSVAKQDQVSQTLYAMRKDLSICTSSIRISYDRILQKDEIDYLIESIKDVISNIRK